MQRELRGLAVYLNGPLRVFNAGELYYILVGTLPLDDGFGDPELVYPVSDGLKGLVGGVVLYPLRLSHF